MGVDAFQWLSDHRADRIARAVEWLAIPSVSTDPAYEASIRRGADWVAEQLADLGLEAAVRPTGGHPAVVGHTRVDDAPADAPRVLFYGHYDVQPPDPEDAWSRPPFEPEVRDGCLYARGASDDKGQVAAFLEAIRAWRAAEGRLPVHLTVLIEGEEEVGSRHLEAFLEQHQADLRADVALISDTTMWDAHTPAIVCGLRGLLYYELVIRNASRDLHSGMYGGLLANPATMVARLLGALFDDDQRIAIPGFYDDVEPVAETERAAWGDLPLDVARDWLAPLGVDRPFGEAGLDPLERNWARPALDVHGLWGGYQQPGAKTVIPAEAGAKLSFRLAPGQAPERVDGLFVDWLAKRDLGGADWELRRHGSAEPVRIDPDSPWIAAASRACAETTGRAPFLVREGATIPVVAWTQRLLGITPLLVGFGLPEDGIHGPDERIALDRLDLAARTHVALLRELAKTARPS